MPAPIDLYADVDASAIAAEIGEDLFPKVENNPLADEIHDSPTAKPAAEVPPVTVKVETPVIDTTKVVDPNTPAIIPGQNSEPLALPKSWKKETAPLWEKADPALKAYVYAREADVMRGINQYQQGHQAWDNLIKPFQPILEANPDVNPIILMQGLMATHLQLLNSAVPAADKVGMVKRLLTEYGITLEPGAAPDGNAVLLERLAKQERELNTFRTEFATSRRVTQQENLTQKQREVETFASDPKNEYFAEVSNDILRFISTGAAQNLADAYELACWANPAVRAKMQAKQLAATKPNGQSPRDKTGKFVNLDGDPDPKTGKVKPGTMDDTINGVVAKHYTPTKH